MSTTPAAADVEAKELESSNAVVGGERVRSPSLVDSSSSEEDASNFHRPAAGIQDFPSPAATTARRSSTSSKKTMDARIDYSDIRVHIITWNIASTVPSTSDVESLFMPQQSSMTTTDLFNSTDVIIIGLQEAYQNVQDMVQTSVPLVGKDPLVELFSNFLCCKGFTRLSASRLLGILTLVFVQRPLLCYVRGLETCTTKTGLSGWLGNKGASSIHFTLCNVSLCFTNCHLVPHPENNAKRIQELSNIFTNHAFANPPTQLLNHDVLVLFGDLNFRLEGKEIEEVKAVLNRGSGVELLDKDQLRLEQIRGAESPSNLHHFMEMAITFPPSYKYTPGTDFFESGPKLRAPAWCDRVLWRTHERTFPRITDPNPHNVVTEQYYRIHMQPRISDHKAVSAGLNVSVNLGMYMPNVVFNVMTEWSAGKQGEIRFEMDRDTEVSMWDWIGLYPENFACVDKDYVFWIYTPVRGKAVASKEYRRTLNSEQVPTVPGKYLLLYKSAQHSCVLGMSPAFPIK